jgi:hypothetical protein
MEDVKCEMNLPNVLHFTFHILHLTSNNNQTSIVSLTSF